MCASQRSADDDAARLIARLLPSRCAAEDDTRLLGWSPLDDGGGLLLLSDEDARAGLLLMLPMERWLETDDAGLDGLALRASHLSSASARLGLGGDTGRTTTTHGGVGSSGSILILGGVGSSAGRTACAMARCTRAIGIAMDPRRKGRRK